MDRFFSFQTTKQKITAGVLGVGLIVLIGIGIYATTPKSSSPNSAIPNPSPATSQQSGFNNLSGNSVKPQDAWHIYQTSTYKVMYPPTWTTKNGLVAGGGELLNMQPPGASGPFPNLEIQVTPFSSIYIDSVGKTFTIFHYTTSTSTISGINATKYSGTLTLGNPLQETAYILQNQGKTYLIKYDYIGKQFDKNQDQEFQQVLATFHIGQ